MIITGKINEDLEPILDDILVKGKGEDFSLRTILDTGFNGSFCLPKKFAKKTVIQPFGKEKFELADGTIIEEDVFLGEIIVNNQPIPVEMTLTESDTALMGMEILLDKVATFDLRNMEVYVK